MRIVAAIQARMQSNRLPNKSMAMILKKPMVLRVFERVLWSKEISCAVLSIPSGVADGALVYLANSEAIPFYAGSEHDVLARLYNTARKFNADAIVRITADCPLIDPHAIDQVVARFKEGRFDYVSNVFPRRTHPAGQAVEVFARSLFKCLLALVPEGDPYREHPGLYVWNHPTEFTVANFTREPDLSGMRWTVDHMEDLRFVQQVYWELLAEEIFCTEEILALLDRAPWIGKINAHLGTGQYADAQGGCWKCK